MGLVDYSSSDSEAQTRHSLKKRKRSHPQNIVEGREAPPLPPLPSAFHDLYVSAARISTHDDPTLHHGRKRAVPHVEGTWPSHIYLEWLPSSTEAASLNDLLSSSVEERHGNATSNMPPIESLMFSDTSTPLPLHISLSAPLSILTKQREPFLDAVTSAIRNLDISSFTVHLTSPRWVSNSDGTRWFFVLGVGKPLGNELNKILAACNGSAKAFGLPGLYDDLADSEKTRSKSNSLRSQKGLSSKERTENVAYTLDAPRDVSGAFHFSIGWTLRYPREHSEVVVSAGEEVGNADPVLSFPVHFNAIKVKIGNTVTTLALDQKTMHYSGILG